MKKSKVATMKSDLPRTPKEAMAPKEVEKEDDDEMEMDDSEGDIDLELLLKADEIKKDSARLQRAKKAAERRTGKLRSIADLKMAGEALAAEKRRALKEKA